MCFFYTPRMIFVGANASSAIRTRFNLTNEQIAAVLAEDVAN